MSGMKTGITGRKYIYLTIRPIRTVRRVILENKGEFENIRKYNIRKYKTFGKTIKKKLYISDEKERYFHIYYSDQKACAEHEQIEAKIDRMTKYLNGLKGEKATVGDGYKKYFKLEIYEDDGTIICAREKTEVIQEEINLCGYFVIVTSKQMTAEEALELYKSKSLAWSSVLLALHNIKKVGAVVDRPKALGDIRGVTYIYGMFYWFGLIDVPDEVKEKMGYRDVAIITSLGNVPAIRHLL